MLEDWPYHITIINPNWPDVQVWCEVYIGEFDKDWYKLGIDPAEYIMNGDIRSTWCFKTHENAVLFKLKWA